MYSVSYNTNNSTGGVTPATQTAESSSGTYTFVAPMGSDLTKSGYGFAGWSENSAATAAQYKPGTTIALSSASPTKTLYAVWLPALSSLTNMTDLTPKICTDSPENDTKQLKDTRDNKTYWVTKLKDGNCWMTQNLDYNDPNSTKVSAPSGWTNTSATYRAYYDPGNYYYTNPSSWTACSNNGTGPSACTSSGWSTSGDVHYHVGNYYSYVAATNGTGTSASSDGANASSSICPSGWKLPTSKVTTKGSFGGLTSAYGINSDATGATALRNSPMYFIPGGLVNSGNLLSAGSYGYYWSSTAYNSDGAYYLYFNSGGVYPSDYNNRYFGLSVRCLVQGS